MTERTEAENFMLEAAEQKGFEPLDPKRGYIECDGLYVASEDQIIALVTAAREQGRLDVRCSDRPAKIAAAIRKVRNDLPASAVVARMGDLLERIAVEVEKLSGNTFQARHQAWLDVVTEGDPTDLPERMARFVEEALELVQALGMSENDVRQVVYYVYGRPVGSPGPEMGGTLTTLAGLAQFVGLDMLECGEAELRRVKTPEMIAKIQGKRSRRHGRGPLPGTSEAEPAPARLCDCERGHNGLGVTGRECDCDDAEVGRDEILQAALHEHQHGEAS